jgi:hypothetical protein
MFSRESFTISGITLLCERVTQWPFPAVMTACVPRAGAVEDDVDDIDDADEYLE